MTKLPFDRLIPPTPDSFHRAVVRATQDALAKRPRRVKRPVVMIAWALLTALFLATGALAAARFAGAIDWFGNPAETEEEMLKRATEDGWQPPQTTDDDINMGEIAREYLGQKDEREHWVANVFVDYDWQILDPPKESFASYDALCARVAALNPQMALPDGLPEGYTFEGGYIQFYDTADTAAKVGVLNEETTPEGIRLVQYSVSEEMFGNLESYWISFVNEAGDTVICQAHLEETGTENYFTLDDARAYEASPLKNWDASMYIEGSDGHSLCFKRALDAPIPFSTYYEGDVRHWTYGKISYTIHATALNKDALIAMVDAW